jgi:hypothetical protein
MSQFIGAHESAFVFCGLVCLWLSGVIFWPGLAGSGDITIKRAI